MATTIKEMKIELYLALSRLEYRVITDSEANILYEISRDKDIQEILNNAMKKEDKNNG